MKIFTEKSSWYYINFFLIASLLIPIGYILWVDTINTWSNINVLQSFYVVSLLMFIFAILRGHITLTFKGFVVLLFMQLFLKILWFYMVDPNIFHDFGLMWKQALNLAHDFNAVDFHNPYSARAVPIYYPLNLLSYDNHLLLVVVNASMIFVVYLFIYLFLVKIYTPKVAQASVLFAGFAPELYAAVGVPSHDILGVFFLFIIFTLLYFLLKYDGKNIKGLIVRFGFGIAISFSLILLHLQRLPISFMIVYLVLFIFLIYLLKRENINGSNNLTSTILVIIFSIICSYGVIKSNGMTGSSNKNIVMNKISYWQGYTTGKWNYKGKNLGQILKDVQSKDIDNLANKLILTELSNDPLNRFVGLKNKIIRIFNFGQTEAYFYTWYKKTNSWKPNIKTYRNISNIYRNIFLLLFIFGLVMYILDDKTLENNEKNLQIVYNGVILFFSFFILALLLFGETNPRYTFPIYFAAPFIFSFAIQRIVKSTNRKNYEK